MRPISVRRLGGWLACWILIAGAGTLAAQPPATPQPASLAESLLPLIRQHEGDVAVAVKHLGTGESFEYRADEPHPTASLIKLPVMIEAYRQIQAGKLKLSQPVTLKESDKVPGSGILTSNFSEGLTLSLRDAIRLMIAYSDNTATNLVVDQIGLPATAAAMEELGCPNTKLHAKVFRGDTSIFPDRSQKYGLGSTTAAEMVRLLERIQKKDLVSPAACEQMREHLLACEDKDRFPALLPASVKVAHKTGSVEMVRTDAGWLETPNGVIVLCVLTAQNKDRRWAADNAGNLLCARIARIAYDYFQPAGEPLDTTDPRLLQVGSQGVWVEILQRTLNARVKPSPKLSIDGDFGPTTRGVVVQFQEQNQLPTSGIVDPETWAALKPLLTADPTVPDPEVVNAEKLKLAPPDPIDGPPIVTARGWAIGDPTTGKVLFDFQGHAPLEMASTTKIMTALVLLQLSEKHNGLLDEMVTFSRRADATPGSTAAVRAGEQLPLRELLFGLMLPSGNDASVAIAEHCGKLCEPPEEAPKLEDPLERFVAEMNRTALRLELSQTHFVNPHGLPDPKHHTSPIDLFRLASEAWKQPLIRECSGTRQRGCRLVGPGGSTRNVVWKNTNKLLEIEGYRGLKTGTTTPAGYCLVSFGEQAGRPLMLVTLGSTSEEARYTDARNLFRWTWQQAPQR